MNQVQSFQFGNNPIQVINKNGEAWFIASEIAALFGYRMASDLTRVLDDDESDTHIMRIRSENGVEQNRSTSIINESGFYHAAFKSRKAAAKQLRKWVTAEVLPAIRKTGSYQLSGSLKPEKTTADQRTGLRDAVNALVSKRGLIYPEAYNMVHQRFSVAHIDELSTEQLPQAVAYVHALTISNVLHGEVLDAEPKLPKPQGYVLTDRDIAHLSTLTRYAFQMSDLFGAMTEGLHLIKSQYTAQAYSWSNEPNSFIGHAQEILMEARCFMKEPLAIDIYKRNFSKMILI